MIQIEFNQEKIELPQECSVADFIKDNPNKQNVVGVLINGESKDLSATIQNKDKIILLVRIIFDEIRYQNIPAAILFFLD